jgi:aspartokinase
MKAVAESNLDYHESSLINFYTVLQKNPNDIMALTGLGVGFGNFAEYHEAKKYFDKAFELAPDNTVVKNYKEYAEKVIAKYPYKPTEKPESLAALKKVQIPLWIKNNAGWWSEGQISDSDFLSGIEYMIKETIIVITDLPKTSVIASNSVPVWVKNNAGWWAEGQITEDDFVKGIQYLIENCRISVKAGGVQMSEQEREADLQAFKMYVKKVATTVEKEKRYNEFVVLSPYTKDDVEFTRILFLDAEYVKRNERYILAFDSLATITYNRGVITLIGDEMWRVQQIASKASSKVGEAGLNILNMDAQEETSRIIIVIEDAADNIERAICAVHAERSKIKFV